MLRTKLTKRLLQSTFLICVNLILDESNAFNEMTLYGSQDTFRTVLDSLQQSMFDLGNIHSHTFNLFDEEICLIQ